MDVCVHKNPFGDCLMCVEEVSELGLSGLVAEPFDPCCSGCGFEWSWDELVDGYCPDCDEEEDK